MSKKTYFASDFHLGVDASLTSQAREQQVVRWLDMVAQDAEAIYLLGDLFDFWFEYKTVVPKGYVRLLGKLAELSDNGIPIYFFTGNHDMWVFKYFEEELGIKTYREPIEREIHGKKFIIGHGDGLGPGDYGYKFIKSVFANKLAQWAFARLHPNFAMRLGHYFSGTSRHNNRESNVFLGSDKEWLCIYANEMIKKKEVDFFIFGHRHIAIRHLLENGRSWYINLGEWLSGSPYAVFDGEEVHLKYFSSP